MSIEAKTNISLSVIDRLIGEGGVLDAFDGGKFEIWYNPDADIPEPDETPLGTKIAEQIISEGDFALVTGLYPNNNAGIQLQTTYNMTAIANGAFSYARLVSSDESLFIYLSRRLSNNDDLQVGQTDNLSDDTTVGGVYAPGRNALAGETIIVSSILFQLTSPSEPEDFPTLSLLDDDVLINPTLQTAIIQNGIANTFDGGSMDFENYNENKIEVKADLPSSLFENASNGLRKLSSDPIALKPVEDINTSYVYCNIYNVDKTKFMKFNLLVGENGVSGQDFSNNYVGRTYPAFVIPSKKPHIDGIHIPISKNQEIELRSFNIQFIHKDMTVFLDSYDDHDIDLIISPDDITDPAGAEGEYLTSQTVDITASAADAEGADISANIRWFFKNKEIGQGASISISGLEANSHNFVFALVEDSKELHSYAGIDLPTDPNFVDGGGGGGL